MKIELNPSQIGYITELKCKTFLLEQGLTVLIPQGNYQKYDLVLERDGKFHRIQCKHASKEEDSFMVRTNYNIRSSNLKQVYTIDDCDCFMTEFEGEFYIFPVFGTVEAKFWMIDKNHKNSKMAKDFLAKDYLKALF